MWKEKEPELDTERLLLRAFQEKDLSDLPLAYTVGSLKLADWNIATPEQR